MSAKALPLWNGAEQDFIKTAKNSYKARRDYLSRRVLLFGRANGKTVYTGVKKCYYFSILLKKEGKP